MALASAFFLTSFLCFLNTSTRLTDCSTALWTALSRSSLEYPFSIILSFSIIFTDCLAESVSSSSIGVSNFLRSFLRSLSLTASTRSLSSFSCPFFCSFSAFFLKRVSFAFSLPFASLSNCSGVQGPLFFRVPFPVCVRPFATYPSSLTSGSKIVLTLGAEKISSCASLGRRFGSGIISSSSSSSSP